MGLLRPTKKPDLGTDVTFQRLESQRLQLWRAEVQTSEARCHLGHGDSSQAPHLGSLSLSLIPLFPDLACDVLPLWLVVRIQKTRPSHPASGLP